MMNPINLPYTGDPATYAEDEETMECPACGKRILITFAEHCNICFSPFPVFSTYDQETLAQLAEIREQAVEALHVLLQISGGPFPGPGRHRR